MKNRKPSHEMKAPTENLRLATQETNEKINSTSQPLLGGNPGLSASDIARSLNVQPFMVRQKLRNGNFLENAKSAGLQIIVNTIACNINGVTFTDYILDLEAAKIFIAKWDSPTGWQYLRYLLDCEKAVEINVPKLLDEIAQLKALGSHYTRPRNVVHKGVPMVRVCDGHFQTDLWGQPCFMESYKYVPRNDLTPGELEVDRIRHRSRTMTGLQQAQAKAIERAPFLTEPMVKTLVAGKRPSLLKGTNHEA